MIYCPKSATNKCLILKIIVITTQSAEQIQDMKAFCNDEQSNKKLNERNKTHVKIIVIL
jgi:hypothetical protein